MADFLNTRLRASLQWLFIETLDNSSVRDSNRIEYHELIEDGTGEDQCDKIWHDERSIASGANDDLDLTALVQTIFGSTVTISFAKVKAIFIINDSADEDLVLDSSVVNGFLGPFNDSATSELSIGPESPTLLCAKKEGWAVGSGTADILRISNPGAESATYRIAIIGTSA